jgi:hypothetical protein
MSFPWPHRRIATEEAFSIPEVYRALRGWAATADPAEPDQFRGQSRNVSGTVCA